MASLLEVSPLQCNFTNIVTDTETVHCKLTKDIDFFCRALVESQPMDNSSHVINNGGRYYSYVSEAVQFEVDGMCPTQEVSESETLKASSPLSDDTLVEEIMSQITPQLGELLPTTPLDFDVMNNTVENNSTPFIDIYEDYFPGSMGTFVPQKDVDPFQNPLKAASSQNSVASDLKRKPVAERRKAVPSKKKCLYEQGPFVDKLQEKKRKDAVRAKRNRDSKKDLESRLAEEEAARMRLEKEVAHLKKQLEDMREVVKHLQFKS